MSTAFIDKCCCDNMDTHPAQGSIEMPRMQTCCTEKPEQDILNDSVFNRCCSDNNTSTRNTPECACSMDRSDTADRHTANMALTAVRNQIHLAECVIPLTDTSCFTYSSNYDLQNRAVYSAPIYLQTLSILI